MVVTTVELDYLQGLCVTRTPIFSYSFIILDCELCAQCQEETSWTLGVKCYNSMLKGLSKELTLVLSDTRELDRVPSTE